MERNLDAMEPSSIFEPFPLPIRLAQASICDVAITRALGVPAPCHIFPLQGQTIQISITQTVTHYGRFELRICPLSNPSLNTEYNELSDACLNSNQLKLAPNSTQVGQSDSD